MSDMQFMQLGSLGLIVSPPALGKMAVSDGDLRVLRDGLGRRHIDQSVIDHKNCAEVAFVGTRRHSQFEISRTT